MDNNKNNSSLTQQQREEKRLLIQEKNLLLYDNKDLEPYLSRNKEGVLGRQEYPEVLEAIKNNNADIRDIDLALSTLYA